MSCHYRPQLHVVLYEPEIPHNAGSVGRTCVAAGAKLWLVRPLGFRVDDHHLRRAGLDYWQALEWSVVDSWEELASQLAGHRFWFFTKMASRCLFDVDFRPDDVFVFGCESRGLPRPLLASRAGETVRIPIRDAVRSLNLSNSVAIAAYEALRQWRHA